MKRYKRERDSLPFLYYFQCEGGVSTPQEGTIKLTSTTFSQASFWDYTHSFETPAECSSKARQCVAALQVSDAMSAPWDIEEEFKKCFI